MQAVGGKICNSRLRGERQSWHFTAHAEEDRMPQAARQPPTELPTLKIVMGLIEPLDPTGSNKIDEQINRPDVEETNQIGA